MNYEQFDRLVLEPLIEAEKKIGLTKGKEYVSNDDRLDHFKRLALEIGVTPQQVLWVYLKKHLDSIAYYVKHGKLESESLESRIVDARTYLALLLGLERESQAAPLSDKTEAKRALYQQRLQMVAFDNEADIEPKQTMPIFCVNCGVRFEPNEMVDFVHIIQLDGEEYNAYYHHDCLKSIDGSVTITKSATASEIVSELRWGGREIHKEPIQNTRRGFSLDKIQSIVDIVKHSDKAMLACEIFKSQNIYKAGSAVSMILNMKAEEGVLVKNGKRFSYNNDSQRNI